jgi:YidC/Oxa1 family membrane protein insertase
MPLLAFFPFDQLQTLLHDILYGLHGFLNVSWAWSIVALTVVVRLALLPMTIKAKRSMLAMQKLQPYVKQLQQKYKNDKQELNARMLEFYRDNKVNPLASCLPIVIQIPIFISLFRVLRHFSKHPPHGSMSALFGAVPNITKNTNDIGIIGIVLIVVYVGSQMFSSRVMSTTVDQRQQMMFMVLPVLFVPFVYKFPVGLMIYWISLNLLTLVEHVAIVRVFGPPPAVILPEDSKGRKKVVTPKGTNPKPKKGAETAPVNPDATPPTRPAGRKNKRRR